jgi:hypothetical protein
MALTFQGRTMGRNPFRLFTSSMSSIDWHMNEGNQSESPGAVPSLVLADKNMISQLRRHYHDKTFV